MLSDSFPTVYKKSKNTYSKNTSNLKNFLNFLKFLKLHQFVYYLQNKQKKKLVSNPPNIDIYSTFYADLTNSYSLLALNVLSAHATAQSKKKVKNI